MHPKYGSLPRDARDFCNVHVCVRKAAVGMYAGTRVDVGSESWERVAYEQLTPSWRLQTAVLRTAGAVHQRRKL